MIHETALIGQPPEHRDHRMTNPGVQPEIADTAILEAYVTVDAGINEPTRIGERTWLLKHVHVGHDAQIGADCELAVGTVIAGHAILEDGVRCGINVSVLPFKRVGKGARIGAGSVVTKDVPAGEVWCGNPARRLRATAHGEILTPAEVSGWDAFGRALQSGRFG